MKSFLTQNTKKHYIIVGINNTKNETLEHLLSIGLAPGCGVTLLHESPLGDPLVVLVDGVKWAIRKALWQQLELVEQVGRGNE